MQVAAAAFQSERAGSIVPWFRILFIRFERGLAENEEFACGQWHYTDVYNCIYIMIYYLYYHYIGESPSHRVIGKGKRFARRLLFEAKQVFSHGKSQPGSFWKVHYCG